MASRPHLDPCAGKSTCKIQPTEVYYAHTEDVEPPIKLRIATGGAGQSGLIKALADSFIDYHVSKTKCPPFAISWIKSDTTASFNHLADNTADLSITYNAAAEKIAMAQGIADKHVYAWRDHFLFVGMHAHIVQLVQGFMVYRSQRQPCKPDHFPKHYHRRTLLATVHRCNRFRQHRALPLPLRQIRHQHQRIRHLDINRTDAMVVSIFILLPHQPRVSLSSPSDSCKIARVYPYRSGHLVWS